MKGVVRVLRLLEDSKRLERVLKKTQEKYKEVKQPVVNFVDDSNCMISFADQTDGNHYINWYFLILKHYSNINILKLNPEKTSMLLERNR